MACEPKIFIALCLVAFMDIGKGHEQDAADIAINDLVLNQADAAEDDDTDNVASSGLLLDEKIQQRAGLQTTTLKPFVFTPESSAYGNALNIQPLLELRNRYLAAQAQHESIQAGLALAQQNIDRTRYLQRNGIASKRVLQEQQSRLRIEKAQMLAIRQQIQAIYDDAILSWGQKLGDLFLSNDASRLTPYLSGQKTLLQITLPSGQSLADGIESIYVSPSGDRSNADRAELISIAPRTDIITQGQSYFFVTEHAAIRTGMRIAAWLPQTKNPESGVLVPTSALIWHLGQAYVYLKTGAEHFSRRRIIHYINTPEGYFVRDALESGELLVITGAQMLLSEEFRGQIPNEDDDD